MVLALSRFGYSVLLPPMRADLHWSYAVAGAMNTANAVGYLAGTLAVVGLVRRARLQPTLAGAFLLVGLSMIACGLTRDTGALLLLRALSGVGGGVLYVAGASAAARLAEGSRSPGLVLGLYFGGVGAGLLVSALCVPLVLTGNAWPAAWIAMGCLAALAAAPGWWAARAAAGPIATPATASGASLASLAWSLAAFGVYGVGYLSFLTFAVAYARDSGRSAGEITVFWAVLALATVASARVWSTVIESWRGGRAMAAVLLATAAGAAIPLASPAEPVLIACGLLFGGSFASVSSVMTQLVRRALPQARWPAGIATAMTVFAAAQLAGPALTGYISDVAGGLRTGLAISVALLAGSVLMALRQGDVRAQERAAGQDRED